MSYASNLTVLVAGLEATPGTEETLDSTDFDVRVNGPDLDPGYESDNSLSKYARGDFQNGKTVAGKRMSNIPCQTKFAPSATPATVEPKWWKFMNLARSQGW
jgi:hypothetical protein